jgi:acyl-coenzyme A thioesterase PaaI-like protein
MIKSNFLNTYLKKAYTSSFYLYLLNIGLSRIIPFNKPHKFRVIEISPNSIKVLLPSIKRNQNHIKGVHACALATLCEMSTGLLLLSRIDSSKYRIIMQKLEVEYFYQAKRNVVAEFQLKDEMIDEIIKKTEEGAYIFIPEITVNDVQGSKICTAKVSWQVKPWSLVKTKL